MLGAISRLLYDGVSEPGEKSGWASPEDLGFSLFGKGAQLCLSPRDTCAPLSEDS